MKEHTLHRWGELVQRGEGRALQCAVGQVVQQGDQVVFWLVVVVVARTREALTVFPDERSRD